jgi:hypothetical protein
MRNALAVGILLVGLIALNVAAAANDPGHDSLYLLKLGDNVTGNINLTGNLTATLVQATGRFFGPNIDIRGDGTSSAAANQIIGTSSTFELSSSGSLILNKAVTGGMVYVGYGGTTTTLNVSGSALVGNNLTVVNNISAANIYTTGGINSSGPMFAQGSQVCTADNGLCSGGPGASDGTGGWLNTSDNTSTSLRVIVNSSSHLGSFIVQNQSGSTHLFINGTSGGIGLGAQSSPHVRLISSRTITNTTPVNYNVFVSSVVDNTTPSSFAGTLYGIGNSIGVSNGVIGTLYGMSNTMIKSSQENITTAYNTRNTASVWNGVVQTLYGTYTSFDSNSIIGPANITSAYGEYITMSGAGSGNITNAYGVYVTDLSTEVQNISYAVYTAGSTQSYFGGKVGIGAIIPGSKLEVVGNGTFTGNLYENGNRVCTASNGLCADGAPDGSGGWFNNSDNTSTSLRVIVNSSSVAGSFVVANQTGSTHLFVNGSSGFVGVGDSTPSSTLEVVGNGTFTGNLFENGNRVCTSSNGLCASGAADGNGGWSNTTDNTSNSLRVIVNSSSGAGSFIVKNQTGSVQVFVNGTTGQLGIGTDTPGRTLHIFAPAGSDASFVMGDGDNIQPITDFEPYTSTFFKLTPRSSTAGGADIQGFSETGANTALYIRGHIGGTELTAPAIELAAVKRSGTSATDLAPNETVLYVSNGGNRLVTYLGGGFVGIGTTMPTARLHVNSSNVTGSLYVQNGTGSSHFFINGSSGLIGIGTAAPGSTLEVAGNGTFTGNLYENGNRVCTGANGQCGNGGWKNSSTTVWLANNVTNVSINNTNLFVDTANNRVGIGTATPTSTLQVDGNINTSTATVQNNVSFVNPATANSTREVWYNSNGVKVVERYWNGSALILNVTG